MTRGRSGETEKKKNTRKGSGARGVSGEKNHRLDPSACFLLCLRPLFPTAVPPTSLELILSAQGIIHEGPSLARGERGGDREKKGKMGRGQN